MKLVAQVRVVWLHLRLLGLGVSGDKHVIGVVGELLGVLDSGWDLDGATESLVRVALLVDELHNLLLAELSGVLNDLVMNRLGSGSPWVVIGDHEEVKGILTIIFDDGGVNVRAWIWVANITV